MKRIRLVEATLINSIQLVVSESRNEPMPEGDLKRAALKIISQTDPEDHIELQDTSVENSHLPNEDTFYLDSDQGLSLQPSNWINEFMHDYRVDNPESLEQWENAIARYTEDINTFEDAFSNPSEFPLVETYEGSEYEIMRFLIDKFEFAAKLSASDPIRTQLNYYYLRYPKLRAAIIAYLDEQ